MSIHLITERLVLRDVEPDDLDGLLAVALSNPGFLATHDGSGGDPGRADRSMLARDLGVADLDPARHPLSVTARADGSAGNGAVLGWSELLDEHPRDGVPWVGLGVAVLELMLAQP